MSSTLEVAGMKESQAMCRNRHKRFRVRVVGIVLLLLVSVSGMACKKKEEKKVEPPIPIEISKVKRGTMRDTLRFSGDTEGEAQVQVFSTFPERIKQMRVDVGDTVRKGQVIAVIEHTRLRQAVAQAAAQLASARSNLAGARVTSAGARVALASALREYRRFNRLLRSGAVGKQQVDMAKTQYESAVTRVQAAKAQARALISQIRALGAAVAQARTAKSNAIVRAPIQGIVARRFRQMGDMATPQLPLITLVQMDKVKVEVQLTEKDLARVKVGKEAIIRVAAHPGRSFVGKVVKVAPTLDLDTRSAPARIELSNIFTPSEPESCRKDSDCTHKLYNTCYKVGRRQVCANVHPLKPGMIAQVEIMVQTYRNTLMVPAQALLNDSFDSAGGSALRKKRNLAVMVLNSNNVPERRDIEVGLETRDGMLQVLSGLKEGETILLRGQNFYRKGAKVKVVKDWDSSASSTPKTIKAVQTAQKK
ncbi:MAG: efflux RND transporter periplasmic adaptor subunit [Deltaproteobacteria bacterium]|nr:MAG: efflux RND transporter periplasmic adaptor subunit [Deltaproteobacteria bacterium]